jgi:hypothetical protein
MRRHELTACCEKAEAGFSQNASNPARNYGLL